MPSEREVESRIRQIAGAALERRGFELVDVEYRREPIGWALRVYIDKPGGITLGDCQRMSEELGTLLEVEDPVPHRFTLEVSSPGLDRPLTKERDFQNAVGKRVRFSLKDPIGGRRNFTGRLAWYGEPERSGADSPPATRLGLVDDAGVEHTLPLECIDRARLVYEWPAPIKPGVRKRGGPVGPDNRTGKGAGRKA